MTDELLDGPVSASAPPPDLDPPFRGYIETTYDSLLVFEAARRGMIPRVTRRLIERERGMVQSGAVFVFDEHESGIKRWTDGLIWSPSRILGNFLVYRETDKKPIDGTPSRSSPPGRLMGPPGTYAESSRMAAMGASPALAQGAMRPRSVSETDGMDRNKERQLVGSLTNSYKFKKGGLVKKTMSVTVAGYSQHMISYYTVEDVLNGKLRAPSTIPELAALDISPDYLSKQNFRFPPLVEVGPDGIPRYRGEGEEPGSPSTPMSNMSFSQPDYDQYGYAAYEPTRGHGHSRAITVHSPHLISPMPLSPLPGAMSASYSQSSYFDQSPAGLQRTGSNPALRPAPGSGSRRYDPYGQSAPAPRTGGLNGSIGGGHSRRMSIPQTNGDYYNQQGYEQFDVKPIILPDGQAMYQGPPPPLTSSAPSTYADYYAQSAPPSAAPGSAMIPGPASGPGSGIYLPSPSGMRHTLPPLPPLPPLSTVPGSAQPHHSPSYPTSSSNWPGSAPIQMPPLPSQGRHGHSHSHSAHPPPPPLQHPHPHSHPGHPGLLSMPSPSAREYALTPISAPNGPASAPPPLPLPPMSPIQQAPDGYHGYSMPPPPASAPVGSHHLHQHQHSHHSLGHQLPPPLHVPASPQQPQSQSRSQQHTQMPDQPHPHHQQQHQQQAALGLDGQGQNQGQGQGGSMPAWSPTHASHSHAAPPPPGPPGYQNPSGSSAEWRAPMA